MNFGDTNFQSILSFPHPNTNDSASWAPHGCDTRYARGQVDRWFSPSKGYGWDQVGPRSTVGVSMLVGVYMCEMQLEMCAWGEEKLTGVCLS